MTHPFDMVAYCPSELVEDHILAAEVIAVQGNSIWVSIWTTTTSKNSASPARTVRVDLDLMEGLL